jgi:hypothetical protein
MVVKGLTQISTPRKERKPKYLLIKSLKNAACVTEEVAANARAQWQSKSVIYLARLEEATAKT